MDYRAIDDVGQLLLMAKQLRTGRTKQINDIKKVALEFIDKLPKTEQSNALMKLNIQLLRAGEREIRTKAQAQAILEGGEAEIQYSPAKENELDDNDLDMEVLLNRLDQIARGDEEDMELLYKF